MFEPPIDGVYLLTVYGLNLDQPGPMYIKNNDVVLCQTYIPEGGTGETGTCSVIAELVICDSVRVTDDSSVPTTMVRLHGTHHQ